MLVTWNKRYYKIIMIFTALSSSKLVKMDNIFIILEFMMTIQLKGLNMTLIISCVKPKLLHRFLAHGFSTKASLDPLCSAVKIKDLAHNELRHVNKVL